MVACGENYDVPDNAIDSGRQFIDAIFKGNSTSTFEKLFTLRNQQLFIGDSNFSSDCLYTFKDGMIYRGDSTSAFDAFMSYEISKEEDLIFIAMLIAPY